MSADPNVLPDEAERRRIREDTASNLFVNAGAGSGKTAALVLASSCVDLRVTQVSNQTRGMHAVLTASVLTRRE